MNITEHAKLRMSQRGIQHSIVFWILQNFFFPSVYENQSNKIFLSKKTARDRGKKNQEIRRYYWKNMQELNS